MDIEPAGGTTFLLEPFGRNTAPAIALGALFAESQGFGNAVLLVLPADHLIRDSRAFAAAVARAAALAQKGMLVTFGIAPTHAETGFGYIECGEPIRPMDPGEPPAFRVRRFVEKPPLLTAREYLAAGNYVWNSGMFAFTPSAIVDALARHAPGVLAATRPLANSFAASGTSKMLEVDTAMPAAVPDISIDYAVMEPAAAAGEVASCAVVRLERHRLVASSRRVDTRRR